MCLVSDATRAIEAEWLSASIPCLQFVAMTPRCLEALNDRGHSAFLLENYCLETTWSSLNQRLASCWFQKEEGPLADTWSHFLISEMNQASLLRRALSRLLETHRPSRLFMITNSEFPQFVSVVLRETARFGLAGELK